MPTQLTSQQLAHFDTFGYLGFPGLLADRAAAIIAEFETVWSGQGGGHGGKPHDGQARSAMVQFLDRSAYLSTLLDDPRIHDLAASLLGDDFNYMGSDGNFYVGDTRWHSDGYGGRSGLKHIKIAFYLDPLTRATGALRIIPGSHRVGEPFADQVQRDIAHSAEVWGVTGDAVPALALETQPGDVLVFNHDLKHSAWGGSQRRRMFTMNCCQRYPEARRVGLSDGARDYEPWLAARTNWQILDFYHASGYLAGAAAGVRRKSVERAQWLEEACHTLKHESGAAARLAGELAAQVEAGSRTRGADGALEAASGYFGHNIERMDYAVFRAMRFPIGSGVTEAACKTLVKQRLCGSGMQWSRSGAQTVLTLRAILLSTSRWTSLWTYLDKHGIPLN